ncbi:nicotinate phosphoribosyltransferase-like [Artemia franciscana]|uniref:nicotinate phosphoribosyltransferase-like n=1 Tax=Artemia franciscana TaxID=6661 RepID=UPI0032D9BA93
MNSKEVISNDHLWQNSIVQPLLTDLYQITMAYAYWKAGKRNENAVFDLFFRKNPFNGEFTIFAGLEECLKFLRNFSFSKSDIEYLKETLPGHIEDDFFDYLENLTADEIRLYAIPEGTVVFPRVPLIRVEGPLIVAQLLETTLLTLVNYASLLATNAARYRLAAGSKIMLLEFGLRRAQGPDGGLSASKYAYLGGFDGSSNVLAGKLFNIPVKGTHAHSFVSSFSDSDDLSIRTLEPRDGIILESKNFVDDCIAWRTKVAKTLAVLPGQANDGELAAFASFAIAFPTSFSALVDTYDVIRSGLINFCAVSLALNDYGYRSWGIRLDSGDLGYLSRISREMFITIGKAYDQPWFSKLKIIASSSINEEIIYSLNEQGHQIDCFAVGTHLVTCQRQPALGGVYKLVEVNGEPKIKLSEDVEKVTIPGKKQVYRLYGSDASRSDVVGHPLVDLLQKEDEAPPEVGQRVLCRHAFLESKRAYVIPTRVEPLLRLYWSKCGITEELPRLSEIRDRVNHNIATLRPDHKRYLNPTPYKVAVSDSLYGYLHEIWLKSAPIGELS